MTYIHTEDIHNLKSPAIILPYILELIRPKSILDVGCGTGTWLRVAKDLGVPNLLGLDGDYVKSEKLVIDPSLFLAHDLTKPINLKEKFDLVLSLEVAEHIPASHAITYLSSLTQHADIILFSAAIPGQGGQLHVNEQWPIYWQQKFLQLGFRMKDCIRFKFWHNDEVDFWYKQNIFLVVKEGHPLDSKFDDQPILSLIHPQLFKTSLDQRDAKVEVLKEKLAKRSIKEMVKRIVK